ncbi:hypothetical protein Godav_003518 [Gossypium davidsonii]|uniref:Uncharacterized protein n=1 Tax=Gossypium davidsonii TaxID=34287 RepID=A0A7J8SHZ9_GOSDV|nr:hypothetical protein [Gossypium davidsonii]
MESCWAEILKIPDDSCYMCTFAVIPLNGRLLNNLKAADFGDSTNLCFWFQATVDVLSNPFGRQFPLEFEAYKDN